MPEEQAEENKQSKAVYTDPLTIGELITIPEAAQLSGFSAPFLRELATKGKLKAKKSGITWLTTMAAIEEYKVNRSLKNIPKKYRSRP